MNSSFTALTELYIEKIHQMEPQAAQAMTSFVAGRAQLLANSAQRENIDYTRETLSYPIKLNDKVVFHLG